MLLALILGLLVLGLVAALAGRLLVVDRPRQADLILVVGGEGDQRVQRGLELLRQGLAPRLAITARTNWRMFGWTEADLARRYVQQLEPGPAHAISVINIHAWCTWEEALEVGEFLGRSGARSVLLVTSQYHSRRALSVFRRMLPDVECGVSAVPVPDEFGIQWWRRREWAKCTLLEWLRLLWWLAVERWTAPRHLAPAPAPAAHLPLAGAHFQKK